MNSERPIRITGLQGNVISAPFGKGSKSEREAIFVVTSNTRYILRRKSGPAFDDKELIKYVGHKIECDGFLVGSTLLAEQIKTIE